MQHQASGRQVMTARVLGRQRMYHAHTKQLVRRNGLPRLPKCDSVATHNARDVINRHIERSVNPTPGGLAPLRWRPANNCAARCYAKSGMVTLLFRRSKSAFYWGVNGSELLPLPGFPAIAHRALAFGFRARRLLRCACLRHVKCCITFAGCWWKDMLCSKVLLHWY